MNERLKKLRKTLDLTQQEFANRIRVKRNTVATYEMGRSEPSDSAVSLICREFNVNEGWLRFGEGEMFKVVPEEDEVATYVADLLDDNDNPIFGLIIEIMKTYNELDGKSQEVLKAYAKKLSENISKRKEG